MTMQATSALLLLLFAPFPAFSSPDQYAIRLGRLPSPPEHRIPVIATGILIKYKNQTLLVTAYHVLRQTRGKIVLLPNPESTTLLPFPLISEVAEESFSIDPSADVCTFQLTKAGIDLLRSPPFGHAEIELKTATLTVSAPVWAIGNPTIRFLVGTDKEQTKEYYNSMGEGRIEMIGPAKSLIGDIVSGQAEETRLLLISTTEIRAGYSGGPVFASSNVFRLDPDQYYLAGMVQGGDPKGLHIAWAICSEALMKAIEMPRQFRLPVSPADLPEPQFKEAAWDLPIKNPLQRVQSSADALRLLETLSNQVGEFNAALEVPPAAPDAKARWEMALMGKIADLENEVKEARESGSLLRLNIQDYKRYEELIDSYKNNRRRLRSINMAKDAVLLLREILLDNDDHPDWDTVVAEDTRLGKSLQLSIREDLLVKMWIATDIEFSGSFRLPIEFVSWARAERTRWIRANSPYVILLPTGRELDDPANILFFLKPTSLETRVVNAVMVDGTIAQLRIPILKMQVEKQTHLQFDQILQGNY
jgi:Trypsin-like peptidase domain